MKAVVLAAGLGTVVVDSVLAAGARVGPGGSVRGRVILGGRRPRG